MHSRWVRESTGKSIDEAMNELTPRDDVKKKVSEILKRVDQLIKGANIDQAMREVITAKEIDPRNVYVLAYEERLATLREEFLRQSAEAARRREEEERQKKAEQERREAEEERRRAEKELQEAEVERKRVEDLRRREEAEAQRREHEVAGRVVPKVPASPPHAPDEPPLPKTEFDARDIVARLKEREVQRRRQAAGKITDTAAPYTSARGQALSSYKMALQQAWADGATDEREDADLRQLRAALSITALEHSVLEREVKLEAYAAAFKRAWASGTIDPAHASSLSELRTRFQITQEEHDQIETSILWDIRASQQKSKILVIDDDKKLLGVIEATLVDAGFEVKAVTTSDEAYRLLREYVPDLILSDINLETSTMGGFTFYEKVREMEIFNETPFLFLSGLTDEVLIRTGKELGVDDYITKPFSDESLIATIRGKLKRYAQIRQSRNRSA